MDSSCTADLFKKWDHGVTLFVLIKCVSVFSTDECNFYFLLNINITL